MGHTVTAATTITLSLETTHVFVRERQREWKIHTERHHLQLTGSKKDAGTSDGRWVESQEHIRPQTIIHEIPAKQRVRRTCNKTGGSGPSETPLPHTFNGTEKRKHSKQQKYVTLHGKNMNVANAILHEATKYTHKNLFYILIKSNTSNKGRISQRKMKKDLFCNLFSSSTVKPLLPLKRQMSMYEFFPMHFHTLSAHNPSQYSNLVYSMPFGVNDMPSTLLYRGVLSRENVQDAVIRLLCLCALLVQHLEGLWKHSGKQCFTCSTSMINSMRQKPYSPSNKPKHTTTVC